MTKKLVNLDYAAALIRHITAESTKGLVQSLAEALGINDTGDQRVLGTDDQKVAILIDEMQKQIDDLRTEVRTTSEVQGNEPEAEEGAEGYIGPGADLNQDSCIAQYATTGDFCIKTKEKQETSPGRPPQGVPDGKANIYEKPLPILPPWPFQRAAGGQEEHYGALASETKAEHEQDTVVKDETEAAYIPAEAKNPAAEGEGTSKNMAMRPSRPAQISQWAMAVAISTLGGLVLTPGEVMIPEWPGPFLIPGGAERSFEEWAHRRQSVAMIIAGEDMSEQQCKEMRAPTNRCRAALRRISEWQAFRWPPFGPG